MKMNVAEFTLWVQLHKVVKMVMDYNFAGEKKTGMFVVDRLEMYKTPSKRTPVVHSSLLLHVSLEKFAK
jgi:hypothetical protein